MSTPKPKRERPRRNQISESESDHSGCYSHHDCSRSIDGTNFHESETEHFGVVNTSGSNNADLLEPESLKSNIEEGDFVVVKYEGKHYPGLITKLPSGEESGPTVDCMTKTKKSWKWPNKKDLIYEWADIKKKINPPNLMKRGHFSVAEMADYDLE